LTSLVLEPLVVDNIMSSPGLQTTMMTVAFDRVFGHFQLQTRVLINCCHNAPNLQLIQSAEIESISWQVTDHHAAQLVGTTHGTCNIGNTVCIGNIR
jgi:hypothetical protein